jgi:2-oxoglutarate dehydrogenase E2 component (dihydrolipoamide succinyltransferase)
MAQVEVTMPKMGESITEGTVIVWHKKVGDAIELDEPLLEIGTDKVDTEVPAPAAGVLKEIRAEEGATVDVGSVIAVIDTEGEPAGDAQPDEEEKPAEVEEPAAAAGAAAAAAPAAEAPTPEPPAAKAPAAPSSGGRVEVVMPKMGESIMEGTVISWHKKVGDVVELDETLLEIATDKVDTEVPSPAAGTLAEILAEEGATVEVGAPIAVIAVGEGAAAPAPKPASAQPAAPAAPRAEQAPPAPAAQAGPVPRQGEDGRFYSPLVRSIAEKEGVSLFELSGIPGSGSGERVTKADVLNYLERRSAALAASPVPGAPPAAKSPTLTVSKPPSEAPAAPADGRTEIIEMDRMRQIIAEHMTRSKATSAHVTSFAEIDVTNLVRLREAKKAEFLKREGVKLTYTPFFVFAAIEALKDHPLLNASVEGTRILVKKDFHVGIAVAVGKSGLMVPVIRFAGQKNVAGLAHAAADLAERARTKKLSPDELQGGTFSVTNVGSLGSIMGTPIINQPQVAILATGAIKKRPMVVEDPVHGDLIGIRHMMFASLSYDHRIIDGAMAASYLQRYIEVMEGFGLEYEL